MKWRVAIRCMALGASEITILEHGLFFETGEYLPELLQRFIHGHSNILVDIFFQALNGSLILGIRVGMPLFSSIPDQ
jgi:hypothetical protein